MGWLSHLVNLFDGKVREHLDGRKWAWNAAKGTWKIKISNTNTDSLRGDTGATGLTGPTGTTGATGATGPAFSTANPTFTGNVGIGTTTPGYNLDIKAIHEGIRVFAEYNSAHHTKIYSGEGGFYLKGTYDSNEVFDINYDAGLLSAGGGMKFEYGTRNNNVSNANYPATLEFHPRGLKGTTTSLYLDEGGRVGIGTRNPAHDLHVKGTAAIGNDGVLVIRALSTVHGSETISMQTKIDDRSDVYDPVAYGGDSRHLLVLQPEGGRVGIGITNPTHLLHVQDGATGNGTIKLGGGAGILISHNNSGPTIGEIKQLYANTSASAQLKITSGYTTFQTGTSNTERMRIDSNGNCRITSYNGTTGSPSESADWPTPALAIRTYDGYYKNSVMSFGYAGDSEYQTGNNVWNLRLWDTNNTYNKSTSSSTTGLELLGPGSLILGAGTSERLRINTNGNVGIGHTNPGHKLVVNGTIQAPNLLVRGTVGGVEAEAIYYGSQMRVHHDGQTCSDGLTRIAVGRSTPALAVKNTGTNPAIHIQGGVLKFPDGTTQITAAGSGVIKSTTAPSATDGDQWYDTDDDVFYVKVKGEWKALASGFSATGGSVTTVGPYKVHTFTSTSTFTVEGNGDIDILMVGGGGGGGCWTGSGGGAGGMIVKPTHNIIGGTYSVVIGGGGVGHINPGGYGGMPNGTHGGDTTAFGMLALGGGDGGSHNNPYQGGSGGSGGGRGRSDEGESANGTGLQPSQAGDSGLYGFGNNGGGSFGCSYGSGGGGGAGAPGFGSGSGGVGKVNDYRTGSNVYYAGGGGAGSHNNGCTLPPGGAGGGANGYGPSTGKGYNGGASTGGGGGGNGNSGGLRSEGGNGGSGIVVVRYLA